MADAAALIVHPDGRVDEVDLASTPSTLKLFYEQLECTDVDVVRLTDSVDMWLDGEGLITGRALNVAATLLARLYGLTHQGYVGPCLLCRVDDDGDSVNLTADQVTAFRAKLDDIIRLYVRR
ncbi:MAG TPA: DUF3846 domain-containing protein [Micromonosporaceae bacterium]|nr:DUF3846 domain-containing protein [Nocardiopsaceae bacterium]HLT11531.1 DUF3846 domain-containing protein [Micromonosporaceae bacterium]